MWPTMLVCALGIRIHVISFYFNFNQHFFFPGAEDVIVNKTDGLSDF